MKIKFVIYCNTLKEAANFEELLEKEKENIAKYSVESVTNGVYKTKVKRQSFNRQTVTKYHAALVLYYRGVKAMDVVAISEKVGIGKSTVSAIVRGNYKFRDPKIESQGQAIYERLSRGSLKLAEVTKHVKPKQ